MVPTNRSVVGSGTGCKVMLCESTLPGAAPLAFMVASLSAVMREALPMSTRNCQEYVPSGTVKLVTASEQMNPPPPFKLHPLALTTWLVLTSVPQPAGEVTIEELTT